MWSFGMHMHTRDRSLQSHLKLCDFKTTTPLLFMMSLMQIAEHKLVALRVTILSLRHWLHKQGDKASEKLRYV